PVRPRRVLLGGRGDDGRAGGAEGGAVHEGGGDRQRVDEPGHLEPAAGHQQRDGERDERADDPDGGGEGGDERRDHADHERGDERGADGAGGLAELVDGAEAGQHAHVGDDAAEQQDRVPVDALHRGLADLRVDQRDRDGDDEGDHAEVDVDLGEGEQEERDDQQRDRDQHEQLHGGQRLPLGPRRRLGALVDAHSATRTGTVGPDRGLAACAGGAGALDEVAPAEQEEGDGDDERVDHDGQREHQRGV